MSFWYKTERNLDFVILVFFKLFENIKCIFNWEHGLMVFKISYLKHKLESSAWENTRVNEVSDVKSKIWTGSLEASHAKLECSSEDLGLPSGGQLGGRTEQVLTCRVFFTLLASVHLSYCRGETSCLCISSIPKRKPKKTHYAHSDKCPQVIQTTGKCPGCFCN